MPCSLALVLPLAASVPSRHSSIPPPAPAPAATAGTTPVATADTTTATTATTPSTATAAATTPTPTPSASPVRVPRFALRPVTEIYPARGQTSIWQRTFRRHPLCDQAKYSHVFVCYACYPIDGALLPSDGFFSVNGRTYTTSRVKQHYKRHHPNFLEGCDDLKRVREGDDDGHQPRPAPVSRSSTAPESASRVHRAVASLLVSAGLPSTFLLHAQFRELVQLLNPLYTLPSAATFAHHYAEALQTQSVEAAVFQKLNEALELASPSASPATSTPTLPPLEGEAKSTPSSTPFPSHPASLQL
eukprot:TRINITY_DN967_c0_g2_i1.p1 TRINITY_DN967_c0_g2~~TRINITY_DN967_c0_g2_i1.p1  ORF type:complete len:302 (+),score=30.31 TRINITY_DN967_c0_g2_i1:3-908(+)